MALRATHLRHSAVTTLGIPQLGSLAVELVAITLKCDSFAVDDEHGAVPLGCREDYVSGHRHGCSAGQATQVKCLAARYGLGKKDPLVNVRSHQHFLGLLTKELTTECVQAG